MGGASDTTIKVVGKRKDKAVGGLLEADRLLRLVLFLRRGRPFIPRGVHRFSSFEEAQQWSLKMMARRRT